MSELKNFDFSDFLLDLYINPDDEEDNEQNLDYMSNFFNTH